MKKRKLRSYLTLIGIFIGIAAVVSLISLGQGLKEAITGQFSSLSADTLVFQNAETGFGPPGSTAIKKINDHDLKLIESGNGVKLVVPRLVRMVKVDYNKITQFKYAGSLSEEKEKLEFIYENAKLEVEQGRLLNAGEKGKVLLGNDFLSSEEFDKKIRIGSKIIVQGKEFIVAGILKKTSTFIVNSAILMNEEDLKEILNINDEHDMLIIRVNNPEYLQKIAQNLEEKVRKDRKEKIGEEDFSVQTPNQALEAINTILNIVNLIVVGIAMVSLIIGGIGIANTMYTSVLERTKDIGTMKAIGAKNKDILLLFVIESGLFGLVGGILGAIFGLSLSFIISAIANQAFGQRILAFNISWILLFTSVLFSFIIGILAGVVPSYQASKLKPVDALRA